MLNTAAAKQSPPVRPSHNLGVDGKDLEQCNMYLCISKQQAKKILLIKK